MTTAIIHHHNFTMTPSVATTDKYQVTDWYTPCTVMTTQWGEITFDKWTICEVERWLDRPREAWVEVNNEGCLAIFAMRDDSTVEINPE
jgi:hypothetical protein